jgi:hypothetical protein
MKTCEIPNILNLKASKILKAHNLKAFELKILNLKAFVILTQDLKAFKIKTFHLKAFKDLKILHLKALKF